MSPAFVRGRLGTLYSISNTTGQVRDVVGNGYRLTCLLCRLAHSKCSCCVFRPVDGSAHDAGKCSRALRCRYRNRGQLNLNSYNF